jgi:citronellol/citronellal dehydrogenase
MSERRYDSVFRADLFTGTVALVTGGGSGIGRCTAHELASLGAKVIVSGRKADKLERVVAEIADDGGEADSLAFDIRDDEAVGAAVETLLERHGRLDALVNNAGGQFPAPVESISQNGFETVVRGNLVGGFLVAREAYKRHMRASGGAIVNVVADMWNGMPGMAHSGAARAGMVNLTKTLAVEWAPAGVRVNAVAPGWIASSGLDTYKGPIAAIIPRLAQSVPQKRLGTESEVSAAIVFLLSAAASFINGETLRVDGAAPLGSSIWPMPDHQRSPRYDGFHRAVTPKVLGGEGALVSPPGGGSPSKEESD